MIYVIDWENVCVNIDNSQCMYGQIMNIRLSMCVQGIRIGGFKCWTLVIKPEPLVVALSTITLTQKNGLESILGFYQTIR